MRPASKKKGRTLPMSAMNGDSPKVPPEIEWDEFNPPTIFSCSQHIEHLPQCDGNCPSYVANEIQVKLLNEARAWAKAGMSFHGIPMAYAQAIPIAGINVELFDLECRIQILSELVSELTGLSQEEVDDRFRSFKYEALRTIREHNEPAVRKQRTENILGIKSPLFGPDGRPLL